MAGTGPYLESNEPFNPIPGLAAGSAFGAIGGATLAWAGVGTAEGIHRGRGNLLKDKLNKAQSNLDSHSAKYSQHNMNEFLSKDKNSSWDSKTPDQGKIMNQSQWDLMSERDTAQKNYDVHTSKKRMTGGRKAGIIGGVALGAGLIGGTLGAVGNYD